MATYAIGDVHGCLVEFEALLDHIFTIDEDPLIVCVGDYVDRGPDSKGVIDRCRSEEARRPGRFVCLKGNHEQMICERSYDYAAATFDSFGGVIPDDYVEWMGRLPVIYETETAIFVHGGLSAYRSLGQHTDDVILWYRHSDGEDVDHGRHVYHGHTPVELPLSLEFRTNVDTACVYGGHLTAAVLGPDGKPESFLMVRNRTREEPVGVKIFFLDTQKKI